MTGASWVESPRPPWHCTLKEATMTDLLIEADALSALIAAEPDADRVI